MEAEMLREDARKDRDQAKVMYMHGLTLGETNGLKI